MNQGQANDNRPYSSEELAERWGCSAQHIRDLIAKGALRHFRVGRLIRVPAVAVKEFEECPSTAPSSSEANTMPSGQTPRARPKEHRYIPPTPKKQSAA